MKKVDTMLVQWSQRYRWVAFAVDVVNVCLDRRVSRGAAELAYYLLMTLFPILMMVTGIVGMLPMDGANLAETVSDFLPETVAGVVSDYILYVQDKQSIAMFVAGLVTTITAASAAFRGLVSISGEIYGRRAFRGVWTVLFSWVFALLLLVMIYLSLVVVLTGSWFMNLVKSVFPLSVPVYWPLIRLLAMFGAAMLFLSLLYRLTIPGGRSGPRPPVLTGAALTALLLTLSSHLFSTFISLSSRYSVVYGSLASVIILMIWLYLCGNIVILGNVFNYVWWRHKRGLPAAMILEKKL
ncbi:MAG: YihY/virulence factor BrkB family protein [Clostridiales bacterium]|nr:YihY/virulence factor BrkB family protein [Clostridiales bacterium]